MKMQTNYASSETTIQDLAQSWSVLKDQVPEYKMYEMFRKAGKKESACLEIAYMMFSGWSNGLYKDIEPREPEEEGCSVLDTESDSEYRKLTPKSWSFIFDMQLLDAAVSHTFMAAREADTEKAEEHARIATSLYYHRQQIQMRLK